MGSIPDGFYEFTDNALTIFSTWSPRRLQSLAVALRAAQTALDPRAAVEQVLTDEPALQDLARRLSSLSNPQTIIGFVTMLLTAIMLLTSQPGTTINAQTVIENVQQAPGPQAQPAAPTVKKPPLPPRKQREQRKRKRRK